MIRSRLSLLAAMLTLAALSGTRELHARETEDTCIQVQLLGDLDKKKPIQVEYSKYTQTGETWYYSHWNGYYSIPKYGYVTVTLVEGEDYRIDRERRVLSVRYTRVLYEIRIGYADLDRTKWVTASLRGYFPKVTLPYRGPALPAAADLLKAGVNPALVKYAKGKDGCVLVPGYLPVTYKVVKGKTVLGPVTPIRLKLDLTAANDCRLAPSKVHVHVGGKALRGDCASEVSLVELLTRANAEQRILPHQILDGAQAVVVEPILKDEDAPYWSVEPITVAATALSPQTSAEVSVRAAAVVRTFEVAPTLPAGLKAWPCPIGVQLNCGQNHEWVSILSTTANGLTLSPAASANWRRTPTLARYNFGPAFEVVEVALPQGWAKSQGLCPKVLGWQLKLPEGGLPAGALVRVTPPGGQPVVLSGPAKGKMLRLPAGLEWKNVVGGAVEVWRPGYEPRTESVAEVVLDLTKGKKVADTRPLFVVLNDCGKIQTEGDNLARERIRQGQANVVRGLVESVGKEKTVRLAAAARCGSEKGNWNATGSDVFDFGANLPFPESRHGRPTESLNQSLRALLEHPRSSGGGDRLLIVVVTPYSSDALTADKPGEWLRASCQQLEKWVKFRTVVVGVPPYVKDDELKGYVNPIAVRTGKQDHLRKQAEAAVAQAIRIVNDLK